jgi:GntR family transcriptional regulator
MIQFRTGGNNVNPIEFNLDLRSGVPIYVQVVEQVQELVATGQLSPGDQLPTVRQLASELRVNFNTIARAYRMLDEAGLISTQQGRGTYIFDQSEEKLKDLLKKETLQGQVARFLVELERQGYSKEQINEAFSNQLNGNSLD